jgi:polyisoprenoid-binding protein YceI
MLPLAAFLALFLFATPAAADAQNWNMIHSKSTITFRPKQMGTEFKGTFDTFSAVIAFDPNNLAASKAVIDVQIGTAHTGAPDRDQNLKGKDWLDVAQFPDAVFETKSFQKTGENAYTAEGTLTIRNISLPVTLPFKLDIAKNAAGNETATMDGTVTLDRSKFQIGTGQWADTSIIANEVPVDIHVVALSTKPGK